MSLFLSIDFYSLSLSIILSFYSIIPILSLSISSLTLYCFSPESTAWKTTVQSQPRIPRDPPLPLHYSQSGHLTNHHCYSAATSYFVHTLLLLLYGVLRTQSIRMDGWMKNVTISSSYLTILCTGNEALLLTSRNCIRPAPIHLPRSPRTDTNHATLGWR